LPDAPNISKSILDAKLSERLAPHAPTKQLSWELLLIDVALFDCQDLGHPVLNQVLTTFKSSPAFKLLTTNLTAELTKSICLEKINGKEVTFVKKKKE
jgi:hypothetical protein